MPTKKPRENGSDKKSGAIQERSAEDLSQQAGALKASKGAAKRQKIKPPRCARCGKSVETLSVLPHPRDEGKSIVEYQCHGESASQEISTSELAEKRGLSAYTVFNAFTSGMMPGKASEAETVKRTSRK